MSFLKSVGSAIGGFLGGPAGATATAILGGVGSYLSNNNTNKSMVDAQRLANEGNMQLAEYSYNRQLQQWEAQNAYNHPVAQMERYREAGLNPNLIYGSSSSAGNANSSPSYPTPHIDAAPRRSVDLGQIVGQMISQYNNLNLTQSQINANNADISLKKFQEGLASSNASFVDARTKLAKQSYDYLENANPVLKSILEGRRDLIFQTKNNALIQANILAQQANNLADEQLNIQAKKELIVAQIIETRNNAALRSVERQFLLKSLHTRLNILQQQENALLFRNVPLANDANFVINTGGNIGDYSGNWWNVGGRLIARQFANKPLMRYSVSNSIANYGLGMTDPWY